MTYSCPVLCAIIEKNGGSGRKKEKRMASTPEYMEYIAGQLKEAGGVTYKKLFGEYGLWREGKFFGTVEDNQLYIKVTKASHALLPEAVPVAPHGGTPGMYLVEELEDKEFLAKLVRETCRELAESKKIRKKKE